MRERCSHRARWRESSGVVEVWILHFSPTHFLLSHSVLHFFQSQSRNFAWRECGPITIEDSLSFRFRSRFFCEDGITGAPPPRAPPGTCSVRSAALRSSQTNSFARDVARRGLKRSLPRRPRSRRKLSSRARVAGPNLRKGTLFASVVEPREASWCKGRRISSSRQLRQRRC